MLIRADRYIRIVLMVLLLNIISVRLHAAEITAIDFKGNVLGQVISTGYVVNSQGNTIGNLTADSLILDSNANIIGGIVPQGVVMGNDNRLIGKIYNDGTVRNFSGKALGRVLPNGLVVDDSSNIIGSVLFPGLVFSSQGTIIGRMTGAGVYVNLEGQRLGFVSANGYAYRRSGDDYLLEGRLMSGKMVVSLTGKFMGSIATSGRIIDFEGKDIGSIHANGFAYNNTGKIIGGIVRSGYAFDLNGKYVGVVSYNGEVKLKDKNFGTYRPDGYIVNENNDVIGYFVEDTATANDLYGKYLGYIVPGGNLMRGEDVVGKVGARGYVYNQNNEKIGELIHAGPIFDAYAKLKGQSMKNGAVISLGGGNIGRMHGKYAYDSNGTLIGGSVNNMFVINRNNQPFGTAGVDANILSGAEKYRISPFGYMFDNDGKVVGEAHSFSPLYGLEGILYSYITPNGEFYRNVNDVVLTQKGIALNKNGYVGSQIETLYALSNKNMEIGEPTESNLWLDKQGNVAYKVIPGNYVIDSKANVNTSLAPVKGFAGNAMIALNIGGDLLGYADSNGKVINLNLQNYGKVIYGNYVVDNNNSVTGSLVPFAAVYNDKCSVIGVVNGHGDIVNNRDVIIGRLLPNGQAISDVGSYIGYALFADGLVDFNGNYAGTLNSGQGVNIKGGAFGCANRYGRIISDDKHFTYGIIVPSSVIDFDNNIIGHIMENGQVVDGKSQIIGTVLPNKEVVSKSKKVLGNAMLYRVAYDNNNKFLGMIKDSGEVINSSGNTVGQVNFDGSVSQRSNVIGYALYDFYVYDENFITYGYLTKDGTVLSMVGSRLGTMDHGFVLDKKQQLVARGNRDYIVRNEQNEAVGELQLDGNVIDNNGENVGYLAEKGIIRNAAGENIALAKPLQYYDGVKSQKTTEISDRNWRDTKKVQIVDESIQKEDNVEPQQYENIEPEDNGRRKIGIALSPEGDIIGDIYDDDTVADNSGTIIGYKTPDGMIVDLNYNPIGIEEVQRTSASDMFIPANAFGTGNAYGIGTQPSNLGPGGGYGPGERYDATRVQALRQIQAMHRSGGISPEEPASQQVNISSFTGYEKDGWPGVQQNISTWRVNMSDMILEDKPIPAVLARSVYASEGFGSNIPVTAIVERNVYAEEGRNILIPAGSRVIGSLEGGSSGGNSGGAVKVGITWRRLIRPDGSQFTFSNSQTADAQGRAGAIGYLDEQLLKRYSMPLLTTALESSMAYVMAGGNGTTNTSTSSTEDSRSQAAQDARQNFLNQMDQIFEEILQRKANIQAVTYVPAGTRIIIFPNEDLWLNSRERSEEKEQNGGNENGRDTDDGERRLLDPDIETNNDTENPKPVSSQTQQNYRNYQTGGNNTNRNINNVPAPVPNSNTSDDVPELL